MSKSRKKKYLALHDNPSELFDDAYVVLFPEGLNEIWIGDGDRCAFRITAERSEQGLCLHITNFDGCPPIKVVTDTGLQVEVCELSNCQPCPRGRWLQQPIARFLRTLEN